MARITGGRASGLRLDTPKGRGTRPTLARVREALFSMLDARDAVSGARVLDAFAGTGALGLEAWSRGAERVVCIEPDRRALEVLRRNVERVGTRGEVQVLGAKMPRALGRVDRRLWPVDLVFLDPPWSDERLLHDALAAVANPRRLGVDAWVVVEHDARRPPDLEAFERRYVYRVDETRSWGDTAITLLRPIPRESADSS